MCDLHCRASTSRLIAIWITELALAPYALTLALTLVASLTQCSLSPRERKSWREREHSTAHMLKTCWSVRRRSALQTLLRASRRLLSVCSTPGLVILWPEKWAEHCQKCRSCCCWNGDRSAGLVKFSLFLLLSLLFLRRSFLPLLPDSLFEIFALKLLRLCPMIFFSLQPSAGGDDL